MLSENYEIFFIMCKESEQLVEFQKSLLVYVLKSEVNISIFITFL